MKPAFQLGLQLLMLLFLNACGTVAPSLVQSAPRAGMWSLEYRGGCSGQEAETLQITRLDENEIAFDDFRLLRDDQGEYSGAVDLIAPMPADGRDVPYTITYRLRATAAGGFAGSETIVEGGGHGLGCPVELVFLGER